MKKTAFILTVSVALLFACNNKEEEQPVKINLEQALKDSIAKFPDSLQMKERLIQYYRDSSDYDKAISLTTDYLKADSLNPRLWDIKAILHFENDDTLDAIHAFERAVYLLPAPEYMISLGSLYAQTRNNKALLVADLLLKDKSAKAETEAYFIKGLYYTYTGDKTQAISFFDRCLSLEYTFMFAYREKGIALYDLGKYTEALKVLNKAVTFQNNFDEGHYWLGRCLEKLNRPEEAVEEYRTALMYSPDYTEAREALERLGAQ